MKNYAIIVAGGKGLRMGGELPKQFIPVGGEPVLMHTLRRFHEADPEMCIILVLPIDHQDYWRTLCEEYHFAIPHRIANGGETRFHSVRNGLLLIPEGEEGIVGVHDGVRPFVSVEVIRRCYETAAEKGAVVPVVPVVETLRHDKADGTTETVSREEYHLVQTPQTFRISIHRNAHQQEYRPFFTDDASVVEAAGVVIATVEGNRENIKITTPSDLKYAEYLLSSD